MKFEKANQMVRAAIGAYNRYFNIHLYPKERHQEVIDKSGDAYDALGEIDRLRSELGKANSQTAHFEREWYLRGDEIEALTAKLGEQAQVPDGYVLVPVEPTREVEDAIGRARNLKASEIWESALAAAPKADVQEWDGKSLPYDWVAVRMEFAGPDYPEDYAYGPPRMMNRLRGILERYYEQRFAAAPQSVSDDALVEGLETIALESTDEQVRTPLSRCLAAYHAAMRK